MRIERMCARVLPVLGLMTAMLLGACSGSRSATGPEASPSDTPDETVRLADYEEFDVEAYPDRPPERTVSVAHDVPPALLGGQLDQGAERLVRGYRIQVFQSLDKEEAFEVESEILAWWQAISEEERPSALGTVLPVYVRFHQPYYQVRIGDFTSREEAEEVLSLIASRFPGAFIAPDMVHVSR